ncbi:Protein F36A2.3 [Aphelenchoides avenae]|nr:Protein F36A2.3 [Aphelenchus avenae]
MTSAECKSKVSYVVDVAEMKKFVVECMSKVGTPENEATQLAELLILADQRGHYSHGMNRLHIYLEDVNGGVGKDGAPYVLKQKGATAWVEGNNALGVVVGNYCTELAIHLAKEHAIGWVVAKGSNHYGICGYYASQMSAEGLMGMSFTNTSPCVFPNRSSEMGIGSNPISLFAKADGTDEFALDMATSTVAFGKVEIAQRKGCTTIPCEWGADANGRPTTNPNDILQGGGLLSLGGVEETGAYKGTGLAMMVELFCGILGGSSFGKNVRQWRDGQCFVAIDPESFAPGFPGRLQHFLDDTRSLEPTDPNLPVLIPGDPERSNVAKSEQLGGVVYGEEQIKHLNDVADKYGANMFKYRTVNGG